MKYTKEFKLDCVMKHKKGIHINAPPGRVEEMLSQNKSDTAQEQLLDFNEIIPKRNI